MISHGWFLVVYFRNFELFGTKNCDQEANVLLELLLNQFCPPMDVIPAYIGGEGLVLEFFLDRTSFHASKTFGAHETVGMQEAGELVAGK